MKDILIKEAENGLAVGFNNQSYNLIYPKEIWKNLPDSLKEFFIQEYGFISTMMAPVIAGIKSVNYNTPEPVFRNEAREIILKQIPGIADDYNNNIKEAIDNFNEVEYTFQDKKEVGIESSSGEGVIIPVSCGKDSLLTLGLARELNLDITAIYVNDTVSPQENKIKQEHAREIADKNKLRIEIVQNNIEKLNDFETWNKPQTCLGYAHMITGFCFLSLPFMQDNASTILLGNQQDMNFSFRTKEGFTGYASYDQTTEARHKQEKMLQYANQEYKISSIIEPLTNIAETKILFSRYPELAKYQVSCDCLDGSSETRWCHECSKCARLGIFLLAHNFNPSIVGLNALLSKEFTKYYVLFGMSKEIDRYEKTKEAREQQLLAFYMAHKNGIKGDLIELFKKRFLEEAISREDELRKKFFKIYPSDIPSGMNNRLNSIFREELADLQ